MAEIIKMPKLSDTMEEGVVAKWHKEVGDKVEDGELLAEIETDKATMEFESFQEGTLLYRGVEEGKGAPVDAVLAIVGEEGEDYESLLEEEGEGKDETDGKSDDDNDKEGSDSGDDDATDSVKEEEIDTSGIDAEIIRMPKLSDTMEEGVVAKWHKKEGDKVKDGELLAEIETDKATMEFESFQEGTLLHKGVDEGGSAPVDSILAIVGDKDADYEKLIKAEEQKQKSSGKEKDKKSVQKEEKPRKEEKKEKEKPKTRGKTSGKQKRIKASPLAKRMAEERHINLSMVRGSGDDGRIIKRDIENYSPAGGVSQDFVGTENYEEKEVSQMRKAIGKRLSESKFTSPHFYLTMSIDMDRAVEARKAINDLDNVKVSFNDLVIKAAAAALRKHPQVNASWRGDVIRYNDHIHIGVAVAVEDGLLVPVVRFADGKALTQINAEVKEYAEKARDKKLQPEDWEGNTFTISNLGMYDIEEFTAIINPPDSCILAIGSVMQKPVVKDGDIVPGHVMKVTMSCDHRVVDGATGAAFLQTFKKFMENPVLLLGAGAI